MLLITLALILRVAGPSFQLVKVGGNSLGEWRGNVTTHSAPDMMKSQGSHHTGDVVQQYSDFWANSIVKKKIECAQKLEHHNMMVQS